MKIKNLLFFLFLLITFNCCKFERKYEGFNEGHYLTIKKCELYIEYIFINTPKGWGVENQFGLYLTDSINFRVYLGYKFDESGYFKVKCLNDSIYIYIDNYYDIYRPLEEIYSISELKKLNNINN